MSHSNPCEIIKWSGVMCCCDCDCDSDDEYGGIPQRELEHIEDALSALKRRDYMGAERSLDWALALWPQRDQARRYNEAMKPKRDAAAAAAPPAAVDVD